MTARDINQTYHQIEDQIRNLFLGFDFVHDELKNDIKSGRIWRPVDIILNIDMYYLYTTELSEITILAREACILRKNAVFFYEKNGHSNYKHLHALKGVQWALYGDIENLFFNQQRRIIQENERERRRRW